LEKGEEQKGRDVIPAASENLCSIKVEEGTGLPQLAFNM